MYSSDRLNRKNPAAESFPGITGDDDDGCKSQGMTMPPPAADAAAAAALTLLQAQLL